MNALLGVVVLVFAILALVTAFEYRNAQRAKLGLLSAYSQSGPRTTQAVFAGQTFAVPSGIYTLTRQGLLGMNDREIGLTWCYTKDGGFVSQPIPLATLSSAEAIVDSTVVTQSKTSSALGRTIAGGLIAGPVGAIAASSMGRNSRATSTTSVRSVALRIYVKDLMNPIITIPMPDEKTAAAWVHRIDLIQDGLVV